MGAVLAGLLLLLATPPELEARDFQPLSVTSYWSRWPDPTRPERSLEVETVYPIPRMPHGYPLVVVLDSLFVSADRDDWGPTRSILLNDQAEYWASRGFVVEERRWGWTGDGSTTLSYLLDQLAKLAGPKGPFDGVIDWTRIAVVGSPSSIADPRVKAAIVPDLWSLKGLEPATCQAISVPVLWLRLVDPKEMKRPSNPCFDASGAKDQYRVELDSWVSPAFQGDWIRAETTAFLRARLGGDPRARTWLDSRVIELQTERGMRVELK